jgi:hypothetical protein
MIPYTDCNGTDHTLIPGTSRDAAPDVTARQLHSAGPVLPVTRLIRPRRSSERARRVYFALGARARCRRLPVSVFAPTAPRGLLAM